MDGYIAYTIRGNKKGSAGFGVIKEKLYEEHNIYVVDVTRTFDDRKPTYSILINDNYTIFVYNNSNVSSIGASRGGSLRIALAIPRGYGIKGGISAFLPLTELCNHFIGTYMDAKSDSIGPFYQFNSKEVDEKAIAELLKEYQLEPSPFRQYKTRSTNEEEKLGYIQVDSEEKLKELFVNPYYPEFENYSEIVVASDLPKSIECLKVDIPRIIEYKVYIKGQLSNFVFYSDDRNRKIELKSAADEYHELPILKVSLDDICKKTVSEEIIKINYQHERIDWDPILTTKSFEFRIQFAEKSEEIPFTKLKLIIKGKNERERQEVPVGDDGRFQLNGEIYKSIREKERILVISAGTEYEVQPKDLSDKIGLDNTIIINIQRLFTYNLKVFLGNKQISVDKISIYDPKGLPVSIESGQFRLLKGEWNDDYKVSYGNENYEIESTTIDESSENIGESRRQLKVKLGKKNFSKPSDSTTNSETLPSSQEEDSNPKPIAILNFNNSKFNDSKAECIIRNDSYSFSKTFHLSQGNQLPALKLYNPCWVSKKDTNIIISDSKARFEWNGQITLDGNIIDLKKVSPKKKVSIRCLTKIAAVAITIVILSCVVGAFILTGKKDGKIKGEYDALVEYLEKIECSSDSIGGIHKWLREDAHSQYDQKNNTLLKKKISVVSRFLNMLNASCFGNSQMRDFVEYYRNNNKELSKKQRGLIEVFISSSDSLYEEARLAAMKEVRTSLGERKMLISDLNNVKIKTDSIHEHKKAAQEEAQRKQDELIQSLENKYNELYSSLEDLNVNYQAIAKVSSFLNKKGVAAIDNNKNRKLSIRKNQLATLFSYLGKKESPQAKEKRLNGLKNFLSNQDNYNQLSDVQKEVLISFSNDFAVLSQYIDNLNLISDIDGKLKKHN